MFAVQHKKTREIREVFDIIYDKIKNWSEIYFLTYRFETKEWEMVNITEWMPTTVKKKETAYDILDRFCNMPPRGYRPNPICPNCGSIDHVIYTKNPETLMFDFGCTNCGKRWSKPYAEVGQN